MPRTINTIVQYHQHSDIPYVICPSMWIIAGSRKARVFPVPVYKSTSQLVTTVLIHSICKLFKVKSFVVFADRSIAVNFSSEIAMQDYHPTANAFQ